MKMVIFSIVFGMFTRGYGQWGISSEAMQLQVASQSHSTASDLQKKPTGSCKKEGTWCPTALKMDDFTPPIDVVHKTNEIPICQILNLQ